jgi:hypothetical protein
VSVATPLPKPQPAGEIPAPPPAPPVGLTNIYMWSLMNAPVSRKHYFIASHYSDGDIHSYGNHAPYLYNAPANQRSTIGLVNKYCGVVCCCVISCFVLCE